MSVEDSLALPLPRVCRSLSSWQAWPTPGVARAGRGWGLSEHFVCAAVRGPRRPAFLVCEAFHALARNGHARLELPGRTPLSRAECLQEFRQGEGAGVAQLLSTVLATQGATEGEVRQRSQAAGESLAQALEHVLSGKEAASPYREPNFKSEEAADRSVFRG